MTQRPTILALMVERKSRQEAIAAGFDARLLRDDFLVPDAVVEIEPILPKGGRIVWKWHVWDYLVQNPTAQGQLWGRRRLILSWWMSDATAVPLPRSGTT